MADWQQRTEAPTPRRREEARSRGQVAVSQDLTAGLTLLGAAVVLRSTHHDGGPPLAETVAHLLRRCHAQTWSVSDAIQTASMLAQQTWQLCFVLVGLVLGIGLISQWLQAGPGWSSRSLEIDWGKLSPGRGWERIWSGRSVARGLLALLKAGAIGAAVLAALRMDLDAVGGASYTSLAGAIQIGWTATVRAMLAAGIALVVLGIVDYLYQRWRHEQELRMTREDLKEERRQEEGDPHLKARLKKVQREINRKMLTEVSKATVVLTNPTHLAVAIRYDRQTMDAPVVVAKGANLRAKRIVELARQAGVPVLERKPLARALYRQAEVGQPIPVELYRAIAEVLAYLYRTRRYAG